jgi:hypothetical protein
MLLYVKNAFRVSDRKMKSAAARYTIIQSAKLNMRLRTAGAAPAFLSIFRFLR